MNHWLSSWKSTVSGYCTVILTIGIPVQLFFVQNPPKVTGKGLQIALSVLNALVGISKLYVASVTVDADKISGQAPENPAEKASASAASAGK